ncbi:LacI family transcriptional regulator, partial [Pseudomonas sp. HMWF005]
MATIKDVAALAGISYTTVSHVVNNTRPVSQEVRLKVEAAIKSL